ncbi:MAG TPA: hypothetical protein VH917_07515 [Ignavibacteriaceae bacterium]|jgi:hypothetical protein
MKSIVKIFITSGILVSTAVPQYNDYDFGVAANLVYTTSAEIFLNPNSSDVILRNRSYELTDIFNPGIDFRYRLSEEVILGLNVEYVNKTELAPNLTIFIGNQVTTINVEDGFSLIPVELSAYYLFPFSNDQFIFLMGGGLGYYRGEFIRKISDAELAITKRQLAVGFHVSTSMDYMFLENVSFRFEMKFRNPQYNVETRYTKSEVIFQGQVIELPANAFETKIDITGVTFQFGFVLHI